MVRDMERRSENLLLTSKRSRSKDIYALDVICLMSQESQPVFGRAKNAIQSSQADLGYQKFRGEHRCTNVSAARKYSKRVMERLDVRIVDLEFMPRYVQKLLDALLQDNSHVRIQD